MQVLITAASKHGATGEIADAIAGHLADHGLEVAVAAPDDVSDLSDHDAVVLGSGVYAGHWLKPARDLVERCADQLGARSVWLFSSGPVGDPPVPEEEAVEVVDLLEATGARDHRVFAGRIDRDELNFGERAIVRALRVPVGDYRDWDEIARWSEGIAAALGADGGP